MASIQTLRNAVNQGTLIAQIADQDPNQPTFIELAFDYVQSFSVVALNTPTNPTTPLQINDDSAFIIYTGEMTVFDSTGANLATPNATIQLQDTGAQMNLSSAAVPLASKFGTAQLPYYWKPVKILRPTAVLNGTVVALTGANFPWTVTLTYSGSRVYPGPGGQ